MMRFAYVGVVVGAAVLAISAKAAMTYLPASASLFGEQTTEAPPPAPVALQTTSFKPASDPVSSGLISPDLSGPGSQFGVANPDRFDEFRQRGGIILAQATDQPVEPAATVAEPADTTVSDPTAAAPIPADAAAPTDPVTATTPLAPVEPAAPATEIAAPAEPAAPPPAEVAEPATPPVDATPVAAGPPAPIATTNDIALVIEARLANPARISGPISAADRASVARFYELRNYQPVWVADGRLTDTARTLASRLNRADIDGLDARAFPTPAPFIGMIVPASAGDLADAELMLSESIATYAHQAQAGRVDPTTIGKDIGYVPVAPDPIMVLNYLQVAKDPFAALVAYNPPQEGFARLRDKLATARQQAEASKVQEIPAGPTLKPGMSDPRVIKVRERLGVAVTADKPELLDETVVAAVKAFQKSNGLKQDGFVGGNTLKKMNAGTGDPTPVILSNMERWRWMPRDLGRFYVHVNIPQFEVAVHRDGATIFTTRIVVGKPTNMTPVFSDEIEHVIVNPYWHVPVSITIKEMMPEILGDPSFFYRKNFEVLANVGGKFRRVDPTEIDWMTVNPRQIQIRQPPGDDNALGNIKFMFPNKYDVYLHDTPSKSLFQRDYRAFSHGCMRVMDPMAFAGALLTEDTNVTVAKIKKLIGGNETRLDMSEHVPVFITYFNAWVDDEGNLQLRDDIYGYDGKVRKALGL